MPKSDEIARRLRDRRQAGEHGSPSALGVALGACLRSGDRLLVLAATERIQEALRGRTRTAAAAALGVSYRSLARWLADYPDIVADDYDSDVIV